MEVLIRWLVVLLLVLPTVTLIRPGVRLGMARQLLWWLTLSGGLAREIRRRQAELALVGSHVRTGRRRRSAEIAVSGSGGCNVGRILIARWRRAVEPLIGRRGGRFASTLIFSIVPIAVTAVVETVRALVEIPASASRPTSVEASVTPAAIEPSTTSTSESAAIGGSSKAVVLLVTAAAVSPLEHWLLGRGVGARSAEVTAGTTASREIVSAIVAPEIRAGPARKPASG